ncbi:MAG: hypothetical protein ACTHKG_03335 [Nocardioides sp.]
MHTTESVQEFQQAEEHEYGPEVPLGVRLAHEQQLLLLAAS